MTLTYWVAKCYSGNSYSIRARTLRECKALFFEPGGENAYEPPRKVTIQYTDSFDLVVKALGHYHGDS